MQVITFLRKPCNRPPPWGENCVIDPSPEPENRPLFPGFHIVRGLWWLSLPTILIFWRASTPTILRVGCSKFWPAPKGFLTRSNHRQWVKIGFLEILSDQLSIFWFFERGYTDAGFQPVGGQSSKFFGAEHWRKASKAPFLQNLSFFEKTCQ